MTLTQYLLGIFSAAITLGIVLELLRRRHLRERHAVWWLVAGLFALLISVFPVSLTSAATLLGFETPVNLIFFISLFVLFLVALQHSAELTRVEAHNRALVEKLASIDLRLDELEVRGTNDDSERHNR